MNDIEAFEEWWENIYDESMQFRDWRSCDNLHDNKYNMAKAWQAAVEYKQKEYSNIMDAMTQTSQNNAKLVAENKKLREALERFIFAHEVGGCKTEYDGAFKDAIEALKEVGEE
jgi:hypothetical protein